MSDSNTVRFVVNCGVYVGRKCIFLPIGQKVASCSSLFGASIVDSIKLTPADIYTVSKMVLWNFGNNFAKS